LAGIVTWPIGLTTIPGGIWLVGIGRPEKSIAKLRL
jgi:hypothetical protein